MARTGLRMMPTSPSPSLEFRTAGFPQYGFKAGLSDGAFPCGGLELRRLVCVRPSYSPRQTCVLRSTSEAPARSSTAVRATIAALPQGPSLRSGFFCPGPSSLNRPHPPHSRARRHFAARRLIGDAFTVPAGLGGPGVVPCFRCPSFLGMSSSETPESSSAACAQFLRRRHWPSPRFDGLGTLDTPAIRFQRDTNFGATWFARSLRPVELLASLADLTGVLVEGGYPLSLKLPGRSPSPSLQPTETFTPRLPAGRSPFLPLGMTTVATGQVPPAGLPPARTSASIAAPNRSVF
jgi:hypothetical protein